MGLLTRWFQKKQTTNEPLYEIVDNEAKTFDDLQFKLLRGTFKGFLVKIRNLQFDDTGKVTFALEILNNTKPLKPKENAEFEDVMSDVFLQHLERCIENAKNFEKELNNDTEDRDNYTEEPDIQRTVRKKGSAVSKGRVRPRQGRKTGTRRSKKLYSKVQPSTQSRSNSNFTPES